MRIFFASVQDLSRDVNGVACHARDLRDHLEERGHQVTFVTPYDFPTRASRWLGRCRRYLHRVRDRTGSSRVYAMFLRLLELDVRTRLKKGMGLMDIVNAHDVVTARAALAAVRGEVPVLLTCHFWTDPTREFLDAGFIRRDSQSARWLKAQVLETLGNPDLTLVCVSLRNQKLLMELAGPEILSRTKVIHLGVAPPASVMACSRQVGPQPTVVNVGKIEHRKNQRLLVDVAEIFEQMNRPCRFLLIGPDDPTEMGYLVERVRRAGLAHRFTFAGKQERDEVFEQMRKATLYFHTSVEESFGMTLIEAMSVGLPVFALQYDAVGEILPTTPEAVVGPEETPEAIAHKLMGYLDEPVRLNRLAAAQGAVYREQFSLARMTAHFEALYNDLERKGNRREF
jgi:glycosyltransferase involved in cell wall biosynthesis